MAEKTCRGILEIMPEGNGFLRNPKKNFDISNKDIYVSPYMIQENEWEEGIDIVGKSGKPKEEGKSAPLVKVTTINGLSPEEYAKVPSIKSFVSIDPEEQIHITRHRKDNTGKFIDLFTPIGRGQRGLIVSPPKAGKTIIMKHIAKSILQNHKDVELMVLLIDERPEEVTDFRRTLDGTMVFSSSSDQEVENHLRISSLAMNMAIRKVECGADVVMLMDSLTRMGRAYNKDTESGGKVMSGGLAAGALELPRRFFGAARNLEDGGSLTMLATILVYTGSRMDDVIFQEFKGTGNMDLVLSRECADRRLFPAVNVNESGTRKDFKIISEKQISKATHLRRKIANMRPAEALEYLLRGFSGQAGKPDNRRKQSFGPF